MTSLDHKDGTCGVLPLAPVAAQDGAGRGGQALQRGRRQNLFGPKLRQLRKALLEIHLRQDPARPTGTHQWGIYTLLTHTLPWRHSQGLNSLVHRVKGLLQWRGAGLQLFGGRSFFISVRRWQVGLRGGRWGDERRRREALLPRLQQMSRRAARHTSPTRSASPGAVAGSSYLFGAVTTPRLGGIRCGGALGGPFRWQLVNGMCCRGRLGIKGEMAAACSFSLLLSLLLSFSLFSSASSFIVSHGDIGQSGLHLLGGPDGKLG